MCSVRLAIRVLAAHLLALYAILGVYRWIKAFQPLPVDASNPTVHRMTWRDPFTYDVAIYASPLRSFYDDQSHFFSSAQHVATLSNNRIDSRLGRIRIRAQINATNEYLHLFMQESGRMKPHPAMGDKLLVHAHTRLLLRDGNEEKRRARVAWEVMLDSHLFADRQMPTDVRRISVMRYYSPSERRAYSPIAWDNPLVAIRDMEKGNSEDHVDISLDQVSLEWMRISARFVGAPLDPFASTEAGLDPSMDPQDALLATIIVHLANYAKPAVIALGVCWVLGIMAQALVLVIDLEAAISLASSPSTKQRSILRGCSVAAESLRLFTLIAHSKQPMLPGYMFTTCVCAIPRIALYAQLMAALSTSADDRGLIFARQICAAVAWAVDAVLQLLLLDEGSRLGFLMPIVPLATAAHLYFKESKPAQRLRPKEK
ncbi:hypothetical protein LPJ59_004524 [Coemansia sp. RSA 2399]|nr:hypothetical protein LPJ59_004524 [Coemansia sp. RSA 2399]KAJ1900720.1 hypothetical protein LPJ81_003887 [Coemansia sp. IMI 209127]